MGFNAIDKVYKSFPPGSTSSTQQYLLFTLAYFMNDQDGRCFPGKSKIMAFSHLSEGAIKDNLRALKKKRYISVVEGGIDRETGRHLANSYTIHFDALEVEALGVRAGEILPPMDMPEEMEDDPMGTAGDPIDEEDYGDDKENCDKNTGVEAAEVPDGDITKPNEGSAEIPGVGAQDAHQQESNSSRNNFRDVNRHTVVTHTKIDAKMYVCGGSSRADRFYDAFSFGLAAPYTKERRKLFQDLYDEMHGDDDKVYCSNYDKFIEFIANIKDKNEENVEVIWQAALEYVFADSQHMDEIKAWAENHGGKGKSGEGG